MGSWLEFSPDSLEEKGHFLVETLNKFVSQLPEKEAKVGQRLAIVDALSKHRVRKAGLLGTKYTMEMDFFREGLKDRGIEPIIPERQETRDFIQHTLEYELGKGVMTEETRQAYISIMNEMIGDGAEAIIFACTEIPMFIQQSEVPVPIFDTMKLHSQAAVAFALSQE